MSANLISLRSRKQYGETILCMVGCGAVADGRTAGVVRSPTFACFVPLYALGFLDTPRPRALGLSSGAE